MGVLNDFMGIAKDLSTLTKDSKDEILTSKQYSSVSRRSMEGIMQFPVIVSRSIDLETLQMITKALEKQFASFLQTAITMSPFMYLEKEKNLSQFLNRFHSNSNVKINMIDDTINTMITMEHYQDSCNVYSDETYENIIMSSICEGTLPSIMNANKKSLSFALEGIRENKLNDKFIPKGVQYRFVNEHNQSLYGPSVDRNKYRRPKRTIVQEADTDSMKLPSKILTDNDVKKSNELVPTTMHIRVIPVRGQTQFQAIDFIAGVKATMHPVPSAEMVSNVSSAVKKGGKFFKTIKWTTGEIAFMRDYLFNLTDIKDDATREVRGESKWWTALKHRRKLAKLKKAVFLTGDLLPNASIVMSIEEVEAIKSSFGMDILNPKVAYKLMREYYLISMVVVDSGRGVVHFLFDGNTDYQEVTFSGLERGDVSGKGVDFKDVLKLVQRA